MVHSQDWESGSGIVSEINTQEGCMREFAVRVIKVLFKILPYAILVGAAGAFSFLLVLGRSDLAFKSLYLILPVSLAALIIIIKPGWFTKNAITLSPARSLSPAAFRNLVLLFVLLNIISICLLIANSTSLLIYLFIIGLIYSLIFVEIIGYGGEEHSGRKSVILFQICFVLVNVIFGQTLRLPLFFGYGDVLAHMFNISTIVETGRITSAMLVDYQYFPALHIFGAIGNIMSGMNLETSYFIFNSLVFLISVPVVYLLVSRVTRNAYIPLIAALFYSFSREAIFNGMYMITRVMAFVLCFVILYLLLRSKANLKVRALAIFLVLPLVIVHHTTLLHFSIILFIIIVLELFLYRRRYIGFNFLAFFVLAYLGYWVWLSYPFFKSTLINYSAAEDIAKAPISDTANSFLFIFTNNADAIVIAFLAIFGIVSLLNARRQLFVMGSAFTLFSIVALILYFPVIGSFLSKTLLSGRLQLLVTPFVAFVTASGLLLLMGRSHTIRPPWESIARISTGMFIVFFLALSSTVIQANTTDLNNENVLGSEYRQYFTASELVAFSFAKENNPDGLYFSDYASGVYLKSRLGLSVRQTAEVFKPDSIEKGYMVFRIQELESRGRLAFSLWGDKDSQDQEYTYRPGESPDLQASWEKENKIFDGGTLYIYMKKTLE